MDHFCIYVLWLLCFVCSLPPCGHLLGKVWPRGSGLLYVMFIVFLSFSRQVLLDCIDSLSLPPYLLYITFSFNKPKAVYNMRSQGRACIEPWALN